MALSKKVTFFTLDVNL